MHVGVEVLCIRKDVLLNGVKQEYMCNCSNQRDMRANIPL